MGPITDLVRRLYPFAHSVTGPGNDAAVPAFLKELPFQVHQYPSGGDVNGWLVPEAWTVEKAEIRRDGKVVYDGTRSPLGVITQSDSFSGRMDLAALKTHLHWSPDDPDAIVYHWSRLYRPFDKDWGFCMPGGQVAQLPDGEYEVELVTRREPATMKVLDYLLPGDSPRTVLLNAHNCHPFQANDDVSGIAVGIEVMRRLQALDRRRFTYRLLVAPELIGPVFWLRDLGAEASSALAGAIMLKSVGNDADLRLQESFTGDSLMDRAAHHVFRHRYRTYDSGAFRTLYGNDETVFEAPPYNIPSISLTRWPFPEYHTDRDTPERLHEGRLRDTVEATLDICLGLERNVCLAPRFEGLVSLSRQGLYKTIPQVDGDGVDYESLAGRWNRLMNCLPRHMDGRTGLLQVADLYDLPLDEVHGYAMEWVDKGLAEIVAEIVETPPETPGPAAKS